MGPGAALMAASDSPRVRRHSSQLPAHPAQRTQRTCQDPFPQLTREGGVTQTLARVGEHLASHAYVVSIRINAFEMALLFFLGRAATG